MKVFFSLSLSLWSKSSQLAYRAAHEKNREISDMGKIIFINCSKYQFLLTAYPSFEGSQTVCRRVKLRGRSCGGLLGQKLYSSGTLLRTEVVVMRH